MIYDKIDLFIRMRFFYNVKHLHEIRLKVGNTFLTSLNKLVVETKASICSTMKENLVLRCRKFFAFAIAVIIQLNSITRYVSQRNTTVIENINLTTESLPFQNRLLGDHSISDIKLPC